MVVARYATIVHTAIYSVLHHGMSPAWSDNWYMCSLGRICEAKPESCLEKVDIHQVCIATCCGFHFFRKHGQDKLASPMSCHNVCICCTRPFPSFPTLWTRHVSVGTTRSDYAKHRMGQALRESKIKVRDKQSLQLLVMESHGCCWWESEGNVKCLKSACKIFADSDVEAASRPSPV